MTKGETVMSNTYDHNPAECSICIENEDDSCGHCRADWKRPHYEECPMWHQCEFPPGCDKGTLSAMRLCPDHFKAVYALLGPS